ncbi:MAG: beta-glucosidase [Bacteroidales bacterium 36-12]|nr:MAG: beta-glucosidase [Bacteroidales bacterium 36-12]
MKSIKIIFALAFLFCSISVFSQSWLTPEVEERADDLLKNMTVREKLIYIGGENWMFTKSFPRIGIPSVKMSDATQGLTTWGASTAYPCALMLASTWNKELAHEYGAAIASDCKARGVQILLGPGVNIHRAPMCGRNFEYMGEDPYLTAQTSTNYIKGLQGNGVMAVIKHFTANYQEYDRNFISSDIDERTLNEIYFPAFKSAVQKAETGAIMTSYNLLNGVWTTEDPWLLKGTLRNRWGFKGLVMSDWGSTHNCVPAVKGGMDLEMAGNEIQNEDALRKYLATGEISMEDIDLKVKHILRTLIAFGFFDREQLDTNIPLNNPATVQTSLDVSRDGIVLLKNSDNILPLKKSESMKNIAVIGNNALIFAAGGGSGLVTPFSYVSYFDGLKALGEQKGFNVKFVDKYDHMQDVLFTSSSSNENGLKGEYFNNKNLSGTPVATRTDKRIGFEWTMGSGVPGVNKNDFSVRWTGELRPVQSGTYEFIVSGDDGYRLFIDNIEVISEFFDGGLRERKYSKALTVGQKYAIRLEYFQAGGGASVDFAWAKPGDENRFKTELDNADIIVAFIGHSSASEGEASDRSFKLPSHSENLIKEAQQSATPMVAVVNGGGNIYMQDWEPKLKGLLWGWYGGQEAGTAMAEVLLGNLSPSGKLPVTFEKRWEDNPVYNSYYDTDGDKHVKFTEGVFVGYRGYDKLNREVQYPFGFGLSYTIFQLSDMQLTQLNDNDNLLEVSFKIKNTGNIKGAEVVQLYVNKQESSPVPRPLRELKNYEKIYLEPNEEKIVTMTLSKDAFSYYSVEKKDFTIDNGTYKIELGTSSRDIKLSAVTTIDNVSSVPQIAIEKKNSTIIPTIVKAGEEIKIKNGIAERLVIYNLNGQVVKDNSNKDTIETDNFQSGVYLLHYAIGDIFYNERFIVK